MGFPCSRALSLLHILHRAGPAEDGNYARRGDPSVGRLQPDDNGAKVASFLEKASGTSHTSSPSGKCLTCAYSANAGGMA